jgi:hypothetical protein
VIAFLRERCLFPGADEIEIRLMLTALSLWEVAANIWDVKAHKRQEPLTTWRVER